MQVMDPVWLWLLSALTPIWLLEWLQRRRQNRMLAEFAARPLHSEIVVGAPAPRRFWRMGIWSLAWVLIVLALARPQGAPEQMEQPERTRTLYIILDVSLSMRVQDLTPSRLETAKRAIRGIIRRYPQDRIGLIVFAGEARTLCPATLDHEALENILTDADTSLPLAVGSNPAAGLELAAKWLSTLSGGDKNAILLTDGEATRGDDLVDASRRAAGSGIRLHALGMGTLAGGTIPMGRDFWGKPRVRVFRGKPVNSRLVSLALRRAATASGGHYATWESESRTLPAFFRAIHRQHQARLRTVKVLRYYEFFPWLLGLALGLLLWEWRMVHFSSRREKRHSIENESAVRLAGERREAEC